MASSLDNITAAAAKSLQSCPTLCDRIDGSPPGSPVPGILQARTLEWGAVSFSKLLPTAAVTPYYYQLPPTAAVTTITAPTTVTTYYYPVCQWGRLQSRGSGLSH